VHLYCSVLWKDFESRLDNHMLLIIVVLIILTITVGYLVYSYGGTSRASRIRLAVGLIFLGILGSVFAGVTVDDLKKQIMTMDSTIYNLELVFLLIMKEVLPLSFVAIGAGLLANAITDRGNQVLASVEVSENGVDRERVLANCLHELSDIQNTMKAHLKQDPSSLSTTQFSHQRIRLSAIEHQLAAIRVLQAEDRLRQFIWRAGTGVVGLVVGALVSTWLK
jgi:hypothetical protein